MGGTERARREIFSSGRMTRFQGISLKTNQSGYFPAGLVRSSEEIEIEKARSRSVSENE